MDKTRISLLIASSLTLLVTAAPVQAQQAADRPAAEAATSPVAEVSVEKVTPASKKTRYERRICKSSAPTGTRLTKKTCLTQAQWEDARRRSQDATDTVQKNQLMINRKIEGGQ